ncbi:chalcone synthase 1B-like [Iris pallida]|uniref:Chalcone synthase 1B-like n=1 Tax=Iris pallida TaxID=29817 RepID=A0AAX6HYH4_IRIPA|nr:chalcone synthase 1B-like [Iris pallida]KAJ6845275.1 chalcone synthase 1B-like [Iris pallida]
MAPSDPGSMFCQVPTIWNISRSVPSWGSAPTTAAEAPSPNRAWTTRFSTWSLDGPRKAMETSSQQMTRTRAPRLFSARSLARRRTEPPPKQPCWWSMKRLVESGRPSMFTTS